MLFVVAQLGLDYQGLRGSVQVAVDWRLEQNVCLCCFGSGCRCCYFTKSWRLSSLYVGGESQCSVLRVVFDKIQLVIAAGENGLKG